jgi:hypothetical protein
MGSAQDDSFVNFYRLYVIDWIIDPEELDEQAF